MRIIEPSIWTDIKWRKLIKSTNERLFWFYLLTCPMSKTCGIFYLPIENMVLESRLREEQVEEYLKHFTEIGLIDYNYETEEIIIYNFPRYNIIRLGKPMEDCLKKELSLIKDIKLIEKMIAFIENYLTSRPNDIKKSNILNNILNIYKTNTITTTTITTTNESCHESSDEEEEKLNWDELIEGIE